jgi:hypothetical protein
MYTLQGKTRSTCHTLFVLGLRMALNHTYLTRSAYSNHSRSRQQRLTKPQLPRKRAPDPIHSMMVDRSMGLFRFSPKIIIEAVGVKPLYVDGRLLGLLGPEYQLAISTFNTCSWGPTYRSLIDIDRGLHPWRFHLSTSHSPSFPTDGPPLST